MRCTHFVTRGGGAVCAALDIPYVPSLFEVGEYCKKDDHRKCPLYLKGLVCRDNGEGAPSHASL